MEKKVFDRFRDLIFQTSGISLSDQKVALVSARIGKRMRVLDAPDFNAYFELVVADKSGAELRELLNAISTNVTHFYREKRHFEFMGQRVREMSGNGTRRLRIWCAACSTGEEPYTIAMTVLEHARNPVSLKIIASDISTKVLQLAKLGIYKDTDLTNIPPPLLKKYFQIGVGRADRLYRVKPSLREAVTFQQINLSTPPYPVEGGLDMIFCRNVMI